MAAFDLEGFRTALINGSRPNQFQVFLGDRVDNRTSTFLVTAASLPGQTIGTASIFYRGREVKLAGDKVFAPWSTTILNDSDLSIRQAIEDWMAEIEDNVTKEGAAADLTEYATDIIVSQLDKNGEVIRTYALIGAWPTDVSDIPLSFDANDQISSFTCTWNYQHFVFE
jgi:hypothetical protein